MKNRFFFLLLLTSLFFRCSNTPLPTDPINPPEALKTENKYVITPAGGTINDNVSGVSIEIPKDATNSNINFTINKTPHSTTTIELIGDNFFPVVGDIYNIEYDAGEDLFEMAKISLTYNSTLIENPDDLEVAYYSDLLKKWIPVEIFNIDKDKKRIYFYTNHFSKWSLFNTSKIKINSFENIDTEYRPSIDGFRFINSKFPYPLDLDSGANGNCAGFAALSIWYYNMYNNLPVSKHLLGLTLRDDDLDNPNNYYPNGLGEIYYPIFKGINEAQNRMGDFDVKFKNSFVKLINGALVPDEKKIINHTSISSIIYKALKIHLDFQYI